MSLDLLSAMITDKSLKNIMVIGTYCSNEVDAGHPDLCLIKNGMNLKINAANIELISLTPETIGDLISDTFKIPSIES